MDLFFVLINYDTCYANRSVIGTWKNTISLMREEGSKDTASMVPPVAVIKKCSVQPILTDRLALCESAGAWLHPSFPPGPLNATLHLPA